MMLSLTLRQLEYVTAIARHGGVSAAASALHVAQPSVSVALAAVEAETGRALFLRRRGGPVRATAHGAAFVAEAERILEAARRLAAPAPAIAFGCPEDLAPSVIGPLLARARGIDEAARAEPVVAPMERLAAMLAEGRLDMLVTWALGLDTTLERRAIRAVTPHALLPSGHRLAGRRRLLLADLAAEPLVLTDQSLSVDHVLGLFRARGLSPEIAFRAPGFETMRSLVANGFGLGLSYTRSRAPVSHDGAPILMRELADPPPPEPVVIASNPANPPSGFGAQLIESLTDLPL